MKKHLKMQNSACVNLADVPVVDNQQFKDHLVELSSRNCRLSALFVLPGTHQNLIYAVVSNDESAALKLLATPYQNEFASLTPDLPQAHWFEREMHEIHGVNITGHPWLKPIRFQPKTGDNTEILPGVTNYFEVTGEEIHEVAVGPVHAGIIEPGHFRFQCHGEKVMHLEIELGYQHRGIEKAMLRNHPHQNLRLVEVIAGDTTIAHATAYAMLIESLYGIDKPDKNAELIRAVALELERMANHTGDLGALAGDVGFLPTSAYCGRIRGDILNTTAVICGNRFGRGLIRPGGIGCIVDRSIADIVLERLVAIEADLKSAVKLLWDTPSVVARFEETGTVSHEDAIAIGLVGPAARACGLRTDIRYSHPWGAYAVHQPELVDGRKRGDVYGRAIVRWLELLDSLRLIRIMLAEFTDVSTASPVLTKAAPDSISVVLTEGWRGEVCHVAITDSAGNLASYKIVDPSFHNWFGLALALRNQEISDFPLCNKSFNLSYCGHDL
ncbi:MAG: NADH-quinone oxidoreductase subunit C [Candidatus Riflebacteria bacterium]|nr:NADH-quinone oxidoreductase subunit C [Candidatus Riflebacteria bacterium]